MEEQITITQLIIETKSMREAQKMFFTTHSPAALTKAKEHEKKVDALLSNFIIIKENVIYQPTLF